MSFKTRGKRKSCVFILTHGRPEKQVTLSTLRRLKYKGDWFLVLDDMDDTRSEYERKYGKEHIIVFDKIAESKKVDTCDNFDKWGVILFARSVCFRLAEERGYTHFLELDDDYKRFEIRWGEDEKLMCRAIEKIDAFFDLMWDYLDSARQINAIAMMQGGDFIGGIKCLEQRENKEAPRKVMNTFFCRTDRRVNFLGRINEDVNTYTREGNLGKVFLSLLPVSIVQGITQKNKGGMTETYIDGGTYLKSFYSVMVMPSAVKIGVMGDKQLRIHHAIDWGKCVPKILDPKYQKRKRKH